ncbi:ubiquinone/menaquinone biosynthesis C-methylase UbiE [Bacillus fengqiuensis]|nr:ubiquinone/menaquinone biosynthesis C-methylase UbiE [Bacillus fengqiuensis]
MDLQYTDMLALLGVGGAHPGGLHLTKELLAEEGITNATTILDIGCGTGQTAAYLFWEYGCKVTACDLNETMVQKANKRFERMDLPLKAQIGHAEQLSFANETFDIVLFESVAAFTDLSLSLKECRRVLKKGGVALAIEMIKEPHLSEQDEHLLTGFYRFQSILTEKQWIERWEQAGFSVVTSGCEHMLEQDNQSIDFGTEFDLSARIPSTVYDLLDEHERLTEKFQSLLGVRVFRCIR